VLSGGKAEYFGVSSGGLAIVETGATVDHFTVSSGGGLTVSSGGGESLGTVASGGLETVQSGGTMGGVTLSGGGELTLSAGAVVSGGVVFAGAAGSMNIVEIGGSSIPAGLVLSNFTSGDVVDLASIAFEQQRLGDPFRQHAHDRRKRPELYLAVRLHRKRRHLQARNRWRDRH
jgi:autotransporter passenger strand-loop-strand repeat protein